MTVARQRLHSAYGMAGPQHMMATSMSALSSCMLRSGNATDGLKGSLWCCSSLPELAWRRQHVSETLQHEGLLCRPDVLWVICNWRECLLLEERYQRR